MMASFFSRHRLRRLAPHVYAAARFTISQLIVNILCAVSSVDDVGCLAFIGQWTFLLSSAVANVVSPGLCLRKDFEIVF